MKFRSLKSFSCLFIIAIFPGCTQISRQGLGAAKAVSKTVQQIQPTHQLHLNSTIDSDRDPGSLRSVIEQLNTDPTANPEVKCDLGSANADHFGDIVIGLGSALPPITRAGASIKCPLGYEYVIVDGSRVGDANGIVIEAPGVTIQGFDVVGFAESGFSVFANNVNLKGDQVGTRSGFDDPDIGVNGTGITLTNCIGTSLSDVYVNAGNHNGIIVDGGSGNHFTRTSVNTEGLHYNLLLYNSANNAVSGGVLSGEYIAIQLIGAKATGNTIDGVAFGSSPATMATIRTDMVETIPKISNIDTVRSGEALVTDASDSAAPSIGSLRWAVNSGAGRVAFLLPSTKANPHVVINLIQTLFLPSYIEIDGSSQPGGSAFDSAVQISGVAATPMSRGLILQSGNKVHDIKVTGFPSDGLYDANGTEIDVYNVELVGNGGDGFFCSNCSNLHLSASLLSGNSKVGIHLDNSAQAQITQNLVGLDGNQGNALRNGLQGILINNSAYVTVGGDPSAIPTPGNIIASNRLEGIAIQTSAYVTIEDNLLGFNLFGVKLPNGGAGPIVNDLNSPYTVVTGNVTN